MNTYAYVGGNPLRFVDPYGLLRWPDYGSIAVPIPYIPIFGINFTIDQNANLYAGIAAGIGHPSFGGSIGWLTPNNGNYMLGQCEEAVPDREPTSDELKSFLSGFSVSYGAGLGGVVTPNDTGVLITTPGVGAEYSWGPWNLDSLK